MAQNLGNLCVKLPYDLITNYVVNSIFEIKWQQLT